jgi:hypothetical protein
MRSSIFWDFTQRRHVVGQLLGLIFECQIVVVLDYLTIEDGTDRFYRNISNCQSTLPKSPEERRSEPKNFLIILLSSEALSNTEKLF